MVDMRSLKCVSQSRNKCDNLIYFRPDQMNINVATWGRLLKRNLNFQKSLSTSENRADSHSATGIKSIGLRVYSIENVYSQTRL